MTGTGRRRARRRRIVGLIYLTLAAVALAIAVLLYTIGALLLCAIFLGCTPALAIGAITEFIMAAKYARLERTTP